MWKLRFATYSLLLPLLAVQLNARAAETNGPEVGQVSPNLIGRTFSDQPYRLKNDKGSPKVINFFWVNCKPCREEMPELALLEKEYPKVKFISVHTQKETPENVQKFINDLPGAPSNIVLTSGSVKDEFKYRGLPHTIILDSQNVVLLNLSGYTPDNTQQLKDMLQNIGK